MTYEIENISSYNADGKTQQAIVGYSNEGKAVSVTVRKRFESEANWQSRARNA